MMFPKAHLERIEDVSTFEIDDCLIVCELVEDCGEVLTLERKQKRAIGRNSGRDEGCDGILHALVTLNSFARGGIADNASLSVID